MVSLLNQIILFLNPSTWLLLSNIYKGYLHIYKKYINIYTSTAALSLRPVRSFILLWPSFNTILTYFKSQNLFLKVYPVSKINNVRKIKLYTSWKYLIAFEFFLHNLGLFCSENYFLFIQQLYFFKTNQISPSPSPSITTLLPTITTTTTTTSKVIESTRKVIQTTLKSITNSKSTG